MNVAGDPTLFLRAVVRTAEHEHRTLFSELTDSPRPTVSVSRRRWRDDHRGFSEYLARFIVRHHRPRTAS